MPKPWLGSSLLKLWADFNEADGNGIWTSLRRTPSFFVEGSPKVGERVLLWDHEGNRCEAIISKVERPIVFLTLDQSTWFAAPSEPTPHPPRRFVPDYVSEVSVRPTDLEWLGTADLDKVS